MMKYRARLSEVAPNQCYRKRPKARLRKKLSDGRIVEIDRHRRLRVKEERGDPEVVVETCPLRFLGVGQRMFPETVIEVGGAKPRLRPRR